MRTLIKILIAILVFSSCTPPLYIPNTTNVTSLTKKGDTEISISTGTNGWDLQTAHAITDKIGIMANGSFSNNTSDSLTRYHKHLFSEFGVGYSILLNEDIENENNGNKGYYGTIFNVFGGYGLGFSEGYVSFSNIFNSNINYLNAIRGKYLKAFIQPSIGYSTPNLDLFFTLRTSYVNVYNLETSLDADWNNSYISDEDYNNYQSYFERKKYNIFYEPTLTLNAGGKQLKFITQLGFSVSQYLNTETTFRHRPIIFIIGLQTDFNIFKKELIKL